MKKSEIIILIIIFLSFFLALFFYPFFPEKVAFHWNIKGEVDGYISKFWGLFLMPFLSLFLFLLFLLIPKIDPLKENIERFRKYFDNFILILILFLFYLYLLTLFWNLGKRFNMVQFLVPAFAFLFFYCGILLENAKKNWFVGIRTPWTLSSDIVWEKTHKLGGKLFKASAIFSLLGMVFPNYAFFLLIFPIILVSMYLFIFSYFEYQKIQKNHF